VEGKGRQAAVLLMTWPEAIERKPPAERCGPVG